MTCIATRTALLLGALPLALGAAAAEPVKGNGGGTFSVQRFGDAIERALDPVTVGWSYTIGKDGKFASGQGGGAARTKIDGFRAHSPSQRQNLASVSKTVTATAILSLLAKLGKDPDKTAIGPYIPGNWKVGPNVASLTFSDVLRHRSGVATNIYNSVDILKYEAVAAVVAAGVPAPPGKGERPRSYANMNYALLRVLVARLWEKTGALTTQEAVGLYGQLPKLDATDPAFTGKLNSYIYIAYAQKNVFSPIGVKGALCSDASPTQTLYYTPAGNQPGQKSEGNDWTRACGSGGWYLSTNDMVSLLSHIRYTEKLLPKAYRAQMLDRELGVGAFDTAHGTGHGHNGVVGAGNGAGLRACMAMFPAGIDAAVVENSATVADLDVCDVLKDAYKKAWS